METSFYLDVQSNKKQILFNQSASGTRKVRIPQKGRSKNKGEKNPDVKCLLEKKTIHIGFSASFIKCHFSGIVKP